MKDLLSHVLRAPRSSRILIQDIIDNLIHALLIALKDLHLLLHQARLLIKQALGNDLGVRALHELVPHII
jgi:hypothetical protein